MASLRRSRFRHVITRRNLRAKYIFLVLFGCVVVLSIVTQFTHPSDVLRVVPRYSNAMEPPHGEPLQELGPGDVTFSLNTQLPVRGLPLVATYATTKPRDVAPRILRSKTDLLHANVTNTQSYKTPPTTTRKMLGQTSQPIDKQEVQSSNKNELETFQPINTHDAWIYSAFFDPVNDKHFLLQSFGMESINTTKGPIYCHVTERGSQTIVAGHRRPLPDPHGRSYIAVSYECRLKAADRPEYVALTFNDTDQPTNRVRVIYPGQRSRNFTVCYSALFNFKNPTQLITSMMYNQVLGAQHFYVYNYTVSNTTDAVLRYYQDLGLLTVMQWPLPTLDVWYYGQNLAINDCVYRNKFVSQFVVIQDTDEYIVPNHHNSWLDLLHAAETEYTQSQISANSTNIKALGSYTFESSLHSGTPSKSVWEEIKRNFSITSEMEKFLVNHTILPFLHLQRLNFTYKYKIRTKTIVHPERVLFAGIHFTHYHLASATHTVVSNELAIVHHYSGRRVSEKLDTSSLRFLKHTYPKLKAAIQTFAFL